MIGDPIALIKKARQYDKEHRSMRKDAIEHARELLESNPELGAAVDAVDERFQFKLQEFPGDLAFARIAHTMENAMERLDHMKHPCPGCDGHCNCHHNG